MAVFVWKDAYSVQIKEIDDQHKKLVGLINKLDSAMLEGKGRQVMGSILKELIGYCQTHFATEERLMKTHGYPEYQEHKTKHEKMTRKVLDVQKQYETGSVAITIEVMKFLQDWLDKHILGTDMKYAPFLLSKGVK